MPHALGVPLVVFFQVVGAAAALAQVESGGRASAAAQAGPGAAAAARSALPELDDAEPVLTLAEAERLALEHQPQIAEARANVAVAEARAARALAPLLPQVSLNASYTRQTANFALRPGALPSTVAVASRAPSFDTFDFFNFGASASQLVYDFGQTAGGWQAAKATTAAQRETEAATRLSVLLDVRTAYTQAWAQRALVGVALEGLANQERHLAQVDALVRAGTRPEIDLAQVRADRANARVQLINAENAYAAAKARLHLAMGLTEPRPFAVQHETLPPVEGEEDDVPPRGSSARPELRALDHQIEAQERQLGAARGGYGPSLGISTGVTEAGPALGSLTWNFNALATVTWPIFQGGVTRAQVRELESTQSATLSRKALVTQEIRFEVTQARLAVRAGKASLEAAREAEVSARERLRLAEGRYAAGAGSILELQDAQLAATTAAGQVVQADYGLSVARAQLRRALGKP